MPEPYAASTAASELEKYDVALDHAPDFSAQVGVLLSCFAIVEHYVPQLLSRLTGLGDNDSFRLVGTFTSFSNRVELIRLILENRAESETRRIYTHFLKTLGEANSLRNRFAHGLYSITFGQKIVVQSFGSDSRKATREELYDLARVKSDVHRIKQIICELHGFIYRNETPLSSA